MEDSELKNDHDGQPEILDSSVLVEISEIEAFSGFGVEHFWKGTIFVFFTFLIFIMSEKNSRKVDF